MQLFKSKTNEVVKNDAIGEGTVISEATQSYLDKAEDPAGWAAAQLAGFELSVGAKNLMDRAVDNVAKSNGSNMSDEDAKADIKLRAELINASGNDLNVALIAMTESCNPEEAAGVVNSLLFSVLKAGVFIANLDYRNFLDSTGDLDMHLYVNSFDPRKGEDGNDPNTTPAFSPDKREDTSPLEGQAGFYTGAEYQLEKLRALYGRDVEDPSDVVVKALEDLRYFFQLTCESFGWSPDRPMPFAFVQETNGTYTPINDAETALDQAELRRQVTRAKRRDRQNEVNKAAAAKARQILLARLAK